MIITKPTTINEYWISRQNLDVNYLSFPNFSFIFLVGTYSKGYISSPTTVRNIMAGMKKKYKQLNEEERDDIFCF